MTSSIQHVAPMLVRSETAGMLLLQSSLDTAAVGGDPEPFLAEATEQAQRLATAAPAPSLARNESFGPANVALWRMSAAMEQREPGGSSKSRRTCRTQHVRNMNHVRELVGHMMRSARRDLTTGELGRLAQRVGAVPV